MFENSYKSGLLGDNVTVEDYMNSWTNQAGYPVIYVETINGDLVVTQVCVYKYLILLNTYTHGHPWGKGQEGNYFLK